MKRYILCKVDILGKKYEINHEFTNDDILRMINMPKIGYGISFKKAYEMRFMENYSGKSLINTVLIRKDLYKYVSERGFYIEFEDNELIAWNIHQN